MPNKADKNKPKEAEETQTQPHAPAPVYAVLFQLEDVAVHGRKIAYDVLKKVLGEQKVDLSIPVFSRYCLNSAPQTFLPALTEALGLRKGSTEKLADTVVAAIAEQASANSIKLNPGLTKILQLARERNFVIGVISTWTEETCQALLAKLGLNDLGARLFSFKDVSKIFPSADIWLKTAKAISIKPRRCLVVGGNMAACKSAMSADLRCVAVHDEFTSFQDYSGADLILDNLEEMSAKEIVNTVFPHSDKTPGK
jgi:beta-phosphoglucomutase-like phosphatase (HAD superfamily)